MRRILIYIVLLSAMVSAQDVRLDGMWQGVLDVGAAKLRIVFHFKTADDGVITTTMDSPDQGANGIPTTKTTFENNKLRVELKALAAEFNGTYDPKDGIIFGNWSQGGMDFPLMISRIDKVKEPKRPQTPQPPFPYIQEDVTFENPDAGITLAGTLTIPGGKGPFPAVILVTGSGGQDRDETLLGHKPFWIIADYLSRNGIAVLRYDDRGIAKSGGNHSAATSLDFATDAESALRYLESRKEVNKNKTGLVGHSEGGLIGAIVGARSEELDFLVTLAGPGLTGADIILLQSELIARADGTPEEDIQKNLSLTKKLFSAAVGAKDTTEAETKLRNAFDEHLASLSEDEKNKPENSETMIQQQIRILKSDWFRFFLVYNPADDFGKITKPVLALNGELDLQVPPKENLSAIEAALKKAGNKNFTVMEFKGLNHLFQTAKTGAPSEYSTIEETFSPDVLKVMGEWILKQ